MQCVFMCDYVHMIYIASLIAGNRWNATVAEKVCCLQAKGADNTRRLRRWSSRSSQCSIFTFWLCRSLCS